MDVAEALTELVEIADTEIVCDFGGELVAINCDAEAWSGLGDNDKDGDKDKLPVEEPLLDAESVSIALDELDTVPLADNVEETVDDGVADALVKEERVIEMVAEEDRLTVIVEVPQLVEEEVADTKSDGVTVTDTVDDCMTDAVGDCT